MSAKPIYLDHAAATPLDPAVLKAMQPYLTNEFYNPSANYAAARKVRQDLEAARSKAAHWLGAKNSEIIFVAGGTEANNLALLGAVMKHEKTHIVSSLIEHSSVLEPLDYLRKRGWDSTFVKPDEEGIIEPEKVVAAITDKTTLVSIGYANNEIGVIQDLRRIGRAIEDVRRQRQVTGNELPLYFHTDACQAANYLDLHASRLGVDLMTLDGSKIYGPKQSGCLYVRSGVRMEPLIFGGHQERGLRGGTENVAGCVGFGTALELVQESRREEIARLQTLQTSFFELIERAIPAVVVNGSRKHRLPNNIHITVPGQDNERLLIQLDVAGVAAGAGSACNAASGEPSGVLRAIGVSDTDARSSLRFAMGRETTSEMVKRTVDILSDLV